MFPANPSEWGLAMEYILTTHAQKRAQQRAVRPIVVGFVLHHADIDLEAGEGCRALRISKKKQAMLVRDGVSPSEIARAANVIVLVGNSGDVVTVMHDHNSHGRRYRRQYPTRKRSPRYQSWAA